MTAWNTDAQLADSVDEKFLATTPQIDSFLNGGTQGKFILASAKGMGKTLLLRHKRSRIENSHKDYYLIPRNETADYVILPAFPPKELIELMEDSLFWQDIWILAMAISTLLNFPHNISDSELISITSELERSELPKDISEEIKKAFRSEYVIQRTPSGVLNILLQASARTLQKTRTRGLQIVTELFGRYITSGCAVFIDSFDQALNKAFPENLSVWCSGQGGLMKAAWELSRYNRHIKIYVTVRQEAFSDFTDPEINNIKGSMLLIKYSKSDLEDIFTKAIQHYEGLSSISEFIGLPYVFNGYLGIKESPFDYIYRHTTGSPRWLMVIGESISNSRKERGLIRNKTAFEQRQKTISNLVNLTSSEFATDLIFSEISPFLQGDTPERFIDNLLGQIGSTVLSLANLKRIAEKFIVSGWCGSAHPFCLLYNFGLLGIVSLSPDGTEYKQYFKKPYEFDWKFEHLLPTDPEMYYLIHPSIHHLIKTKNYNFTYNRVRIGDDLLWGEKESRQVRSDKVRIFVSYSHDDLFLVKQIVENLQKYLSEQSKIHDIWFDQWKMRSGRWFQDQMNAGLAESDDLILIVSKNSLGSNAVAVEWKTKFQRKISIGADTIFPLIIDDTPYSELPDYLSNIHAYRYDGKIDCIIRLADDMLFWKEEEATKEKERRRVDRKSAKQPTSKD